MATLVPSLPRQFQSQLPRGLRKVGQALSRDLEGAHLVAHVAVQPFALRLQGHPRILVHFGVQLNDLKGTLARRIRTQRNAAHNLVENSRALT